MYGTSLIIYFIYLIKVSHVDDEPHAEDEEDDTHDPFPTLQHALEVLPSHVGFNVEIKWTMETRVCNSL
jgi:glycerophosphocholine phosphodiesterase GPCPD1